MFILFRFSLNNLKDSTIIIAIINPITKYSEMTYLVGILSMVNLCISIRNQDKKTINDNLKFLEVCFKNTKMNPIGNNTENDNVKISMSFLRNSW